MPNVALIAGNLVSDSGVEVSAINAQNYARKHSARDFPNGTLIETTIDYSVTNGDPFVLEITGNSYGSLIPFNLAYQGYIYNNTTINHGGISIGAAISGMSLFNYNGKLCFWFPSQGYWQGFNVYVYIADTGFRENKVTNITNVAKPAGITKEISMTFQQVIRASSASVGTTNYVAKFTGNVAVGDSQIFDNGTNVGIGTTSPTYQLHATSTGYFGGTLTLGGGSRLSAVSGNGLNLNTNGSDRVTIDTSGNVGIGTTSPSYKLHIVQNATAGRLNMANIDRTSAALIRVTNPQYSTDASSGIMFRVFPDTDARQGAGLIASGGSNNGSTDLDLFVTASPDGLGGTSFSALRIRGVDGNVGIGTTTPATKLDVNGIIRVSTTDQSTNRFRLFNQNSGQTWDIIGGLNGANNTDFSIYDGSNTRFVITSSGNVGIGTTSPNVKLEVSGLVRVTGTNGFSLGGDAGQNRIQYNTSTFSRFALLSSGDGYTGLTAKELSIGATYGGIAPPSSGAIIEGNLLIGTTVDVSNKLVVRGTSRIANSDGASMLYVTHGATTGNTYTELDALIGSGGGWGNLIFQSGGGNVGIGTITPEARLDVSGNVYVGTPGTDASIFLRGYNSGLTRLSTNAGSSANYNGFLISVNSSQVNSLPTWNFDFGGFDRFNYVQDAFSVWRTPSGGTKTNLFTVLGGGNVGIGTTNPDSTSLRIVPVSTDLVQRVLHIGYNGSMSTGTHGSLITFGNTTPSTAQLARIGAFYEGSTYMGSLRFYTNADTEGANPSERMRITAAGNVGIGATNPGSMINSGAFFKPETAGEHLDILSPSNEAVINLRSNRDTNGGQVGGIYFTRDAGQGDAHRHIGAIQVRQKNTGTLAGGEMLFFTKTSNSGVGVDAARMIIDTSGGITIPALGGTGTRIVTADANGFLAASTLSSSIVGGSGTTNYVARWTSSSALGTGVLFDNGSFVGVGITSNFAGGPRLYVSKTTASEEILRVDGQGGAGCLIISNTASSVQTVFYNGNIGVGTLSPQQKFVVSNVGAEGLEFIPAPSVNSNQIQSYNRSTSSWNSLILRASEYNVQIGTTATLYINGSGNVGIGTTTPNTRLDVVATKNTTGLRLSPSAASAANDYTQIGVGNPGADADYASIRFTYENGLSNWYNTAISFHTFARFPGNALLERMRINGDGNVGIATSNPLNFLDVYSNNRTSLTAIGGGINVNYTGNTTGQFSTIGFSWAQSIDGATRWGMGLTGTSFASGLADLFFFNGGVERMRITSAGNIGIGTTSGITGKLTISSSLGDQIKLDRTGQTSRGIVISAADNLSIGTWVDPTQVSITPSGNVGIGTTGPSKKLVVAAPPPTFSGDDGIIVIDPATANQTYLARCGSTYTYRAVPPNAGMLYSNTDLSLLADSGYAITFHTSSGHVARLTAAGNFGIGTTSPTQKLEVHGDILIENGADSVSKLIISNGGGGNAEIIGSEADGILRIKNGNSGVPIIHFLNSGDSVMMAINNSNVGIGTTTPQAILETYKSAGTTDFVGLRMHNYDASSRNTSSTSVSFFVGATQERARITAGNPDDFSGANGFLTFSTRISESVTEKMRITSGGNVGIGTTSPTERLDVRTTVVRDPSSGEAHAAFYTNAAQSIDRGASITLGGGINNAGTSVTNFATISGLKENSTENNTAGTLSFWTRVNAGPMTRKMTITSDGNVGIGNTSAYYRTHISQPKNTTGLFISNSPSTADDYTQIGFGFDTYNVACAAVRAVAENPAGSFNHHLAFHTYNTTLQERMRITSTGNIGIGTTSPAARLDVFTTSTNGIDLRNAPTTVGDQTSKSSPRLRLVSSRYEGGNVDAPFSFQNIRTGSPTNDQRLAITNFGDVEVLSITNLGFVGIGTTSPNERMTIQGAASAGAAITLRGNNAASSNEMLIGQGNANESYVYNRANQPMIFGTNNTERLRIFANGRVAINTTTDAGYQLDVNGGTRVTGRITVTGNDTLGLSVVRAGTSAISSEIYNSGGDNSWMLWGAESSVGGVIFPGSTAYAAVIGQFRNTPLEFFTNNTIRGSFSGAGAFRVHNLAGTGTRVVVADANGVLSTSASAAVTGSGTTNYISKFTAAGVIGDSQIFDNGTNVGIGTASPSFRLDVQSAASTIVRIKGGTGAAQGSAYYQTFAGSTNTMSAFGDRANIFGGTVDQIASIYTGANIPLTFDINATERMRITAGGNVGVNTASPVMPLQLNNYGGFDGNGNQLIIRNNVYYNTTNARSEPIQNGYQTQIEMENIDGKIRFSTSSASNTVGSAASLVERMRITNNGEVWINTTSDAGDYKLQVAGNIYNTGSAVLAATSGNVGIGTTSPAAKLDIAYSTNPTTATPHILLSTGGTAKQAAITAEAFAVGGLVFSTGDGTLVDRMTILRTNGNVGIGTTAPSTKLHVVGQTYITDDLLIRGTHNPYASSGRGVVALNGTAGNIISFASSTTTHGYMFVTNAQYEFVTVANQNFLFYNGSTEALRITNAGNVGIGTTSPAQRLDVSGVIRANSGTIYAQASGTESSGYQLNAITMGYDAAANIGWVTAGGAAARTNLVLQQSGGNVLIGTATSSGYRLQVSGSIYGSAGIDITQSFFSSGTAAGLYINGTTNGASIQALSQSLTGSNASALFSGGTTWNTTGSPSLIDILVTNTASGASSNFIKISDSINTFRVTKDAGLITSNPTGGTAKKWKLGSVVSTTVTMVTSQYVEVEIDGTFYRLALVTPA